MVKNQRIRQGLIVWLTIAAVLLLPVSGVTQTKIVYHSNKYKPADDVKLGREAAQQAEQQFPVLRDRQATDYLSTVGQRLVDAIPPEFQHPEFHYYFKILNVSDINAFALPGGPMYVNRGMIEAARTEGEVAGWIPESATTKLLVRSRTMALSVSSSSCFTAPALADAIASERMTFCRMNSAICGLFRARLKLSRATAFADRRAIRFQDIDAAGIIFYPRVLEMFHDTYAAFLAFAGAPLPEVLRSGTWLAPCT